MGYLCDWVCNCINSSGTRLRAAYSLTKADMATRDTITNQRHKAVVLLSGGMDSCVCAAIARESHELALLHASYGQRTESRERQSFDEIADYYAVHERLV